MCANPTMSAAVSVPAARDIGTASSARGKPSPPPDIERWLLEDEVVRLRADLAQLVRLHYRLDDEPPLDDTPKE